MKNSVPLHRPAMVRETFQAILLMEGGYGFDPDDPGGHTKYGVTQYSLQYAIQQGIVQDPAPGQDIAQKVKMLKIEDAQKIFEHNYANKWRGLPQPLFFTLTHITWASGYGTTLHLINKMGPYKDRIINFRSNVETNSSISDLCDRLFFIRCSFYEWLVTKKDPKLMKFKPGWFYSLCAIHESHYSGFFKWYGQVVKLF